MFVGWLNVCGIWLNVCGIWLGRTDLCCLECDLHMVVCNGLGCFLSWFGYSLGGLVFFV